MAFKEVDPGPVLDGAFFKFNAIGDQLIAVFVKVTEGINNFGKKQNSYTFKNKEGLHTVDATFDLNRRLVAAKLEPGDKVMIKFNSELPPTQEGHSPQKIFKVMVDNEVTPELRAAIVKLAGAPAPAAPKAPAAPPVDPLDDLTF